MSQDIILDINKKHLAENLAELNAAHRQINGRELIEAEYKRLQAMNQKYTHAFVGSKNVVIGRSHDQVNGETFSFESLSEFANRFIHVEPIAGRNPGKAWLAWSGKNHKLNGTGFYPDSQKCPEGVFNFYQGLRLKPKQGDVEPYLYHLREIICGGELEAFDYLVQWLAHLFQKPDIKPTVAVLLKSVEGTGKGTMTYPLFKILGSHAAQTNGSYAITGRFNSTLANRLLIFADEVELTDRRIADKLKAIISEPSVSLERKGLEIEPLPNYCRLIFASNHDHVIHAGTRERRYLVLAPSDAKVGDKAYFKELRHWADNGGTEALLHYLLNLNIGDFNPFSCPQTRALIDEKLASLSGIMQFLYGEIFNDAPFGGGSRISASDLVSKFLNWSDEHDLYITLPTARSTIGRSMHKLGIPVMGRSDVGAGKFYDLPDRESMQSAFADLLGVKLGDIGLSN